MATGCGYRSQILGLDVLEDTMVDLGREVEKVSHSLSAPFGSGDTYERLITTAILFKFSMKSDQNIPRVYCRLSRGIHSPMPGRR